MPSSDGDGLVIDMIAYPDATIIDQLYLARLRAGTPLTATGGLTRFELELGGDGAVRRRTLSPIPIELPRINYASCAGKPYRYVWGTGIEVEGDFLDQIVKIDLATGASRAGTRRAAIRANRIRSCAVRRAEDDGVLLSLVLDPDKGRSFLLVLDAATLDETRAPKPPRHSLPLPRQLLRRRLSAGGNPSAGKMTLADAALGMPARSSARMIALNGKD